MPFQVHVFDVSTQVRLLDESDAPTTSEANILYTFSGHTDEGFALDWSGIVPGRLLTGDCASRVHLWEPTPGGSWTVGKQQYVGHASSVEDLQWSPNEAGVFGKVAAVSEPRVKGWRAHFFSNSLLLQRSHYSHLGCSAS